MTTSGPFIARELKVFQAAENGDSEELTSLLSRGVNLNWRGERGRTALLASCKGGHTQCCSLLLRAGADANCPNDVGVTPLMLASVGAHAECVRHLLKCNADRTCKDNAGKSALDYAPTSKMLKQLRAGRVGDRAAGARENERSAKRNILGSARSSARRSMPSLGEGVLSTQL